MCAGGPTIVAPLLLLVLPVRGDAELGGAVHRVGADLHLDRLAGRADDRRVQRLVHVELRHRDVVLEPARHRLPVRVDDAERRVAVADRVDQDAHADQVVDVVEVATPHDHLLVDRVEVLRPAGDLRLDLRGLEVGVRPCWVTWRSSASRCGWCSPIRRLISSNRFGNSVPNARSSSSHLIVFIPRRWASGARISSVSLAFCSCLGRGQEGQRAHVVQPVGELDDQHPRVLGHRDDHLADRLGLGRVAELDLVELGDAVDQQRDLAAEVGAHLRRGVYSVSSIVSCSSAATSVVVSMPRLARIVATASGWVMYGSPDLRYCPECQRAAMSKARCSSRASALGWLARWVAISGSSTSLTCGVCQGALNRASRARTRRPVGRAGQAEAAAARRAGRRSGTGPTSPSAAGRRHSTVAARSSATAWRLDLGRGLVGARRRRAVIDRRRRCRSASRRRRRSSPVGCTVPSTGGATSLDTGRSSPLAGTCTGRTGRR